MVLRASCFGVSFGKLVRKNVLFGSSLWGRSFFQGIFRNNDQALSLVSIAIIDWIDCGSSSSLC